MLRMRWVAVFASAVLLSACGGDNGGAGAPPAAEPIRAFVAAGGEGSDTERAEVLLLRAEAQPRASVRLKAGRANGAKALLGGAEVIEIARERDGQGRYLLNAPDSGPDGHLVSARAVRDARLGVNALIELLAPLALFEGEASLVINPVTTLVVLTSSSLSGPDVTQTLARLLDALGAGDLQDPRANVPLLFALAMGEFVPGWPQQIAAEPDNLYALLHNLDPDTVPASLRPEFRFRRDVALAILAALDDPAVVDLTVEANAIEFAARATRLLDEAGIAVDPEHVRALADATVSANGGRSLGEAQVTGNVVRYLVNEYQIQDLASALPTQLLSQIAADSAVAQLAAAGGVILTSVPLLDGELLGNDQERRRNYYYQSERSPLSFVPVLYAGITDANITDHGQVALVIANARAGRMAEAEFIARTQIFGTVAEAEGLIQMANAYRGFRRDEEALSGYRDALEFYLEYVDEKGLANFTAADAQFLQRLVGKPGEFGFLSLGDEDGALRAAAPMDAFVEAYGQGDYQTAIGRYLTALARVASDAVDTAVASGLSPAQRSAAEQEVDSFRQLLRSVRIPQPYSTSHGCRFYSNGSGESHYAVRAINMVSVVNHYQRLGLHDKALAVVDEDLPLVRGNDYASCRTEIYLDDVAADLVRMGMDERAEALLESFVARGDASDSAVPDYVAAARAEMAGAMSDVLRDQGDIEGAVAVVLDFISGNFRSRDIMRQLTYFSGANRGLGGTLVDRGQFAQAKIAIDGALAFFNDEEYAAWISSRPSSPWAVLIPEGGKITDLYAEAGYVEEAHAAAAQVEAWARADYSQTAASRYDLLRLLVDEVYHPIGALNHSLDLLHEAASEARQQDPAVAAGNLNTLARMMVRLDVANVPSAAVLLEEAHGLASGVCCEGIPESELAAVRNRQFELLRSIGLSHAETVGRSRQAVWMAARAGEDVSVLRAPVAVHRERARDIQLQAADLAASIGNVGTRTINLHLIALDLAKLNWRHEAMATAERIGSAQERHYAFRSVALALLKINDSFTGTSYNSAFGFTSNVLFAGYNDYPVYSRDRHDPERVSTLISVDTDGDGLPDFYSPLATQAQIEAIGLPLDEDMDGDGVPDSMDRYPLDPARN